jgi:dTDP-4-amino-4,6-dideoxygalactose transaminase
VPCHRQPPLRQFADRPLRVAEQAAGELLSLPMFPHLTESQVRFVCESLGDALGKIGKMTPGTELIDVP